MATDVRAQPGPLRAASGIYQLRNLQTDARYIGSSLSVRKRVQKHWRSLRGGSHPNSHLQRAWAQYGEASFAGEALEYCSTDREVLIQREQAWFDALRPAYNLSWYADRPEWRPESRAKVSESLRGRPKSLEHRARAAAAWVGRRHTDETKEKIRQALTGRTLPPDVIEKVSRALRGKAKTPEHIAKVVARIRSRPPASADTRARIAAANRRRLPQSAETRAKRSASMLRTFAQRRVNAGN